LVCHPLSKSKVKIILTENQFTAGEKVSKKFTANSCWPPCAFSRAFCWYTSLVLCLYFSSYKEKRRLTGLARKNDGSPVSAGLHVTTDGYAIGPECLTWARRMHLERGRKYIEKQAAGDLERIRLKGKVDVVLSKGPTPIEGKWKNQDLKFMIHWYKRVGDMAMPKNKEGLLLRHRETCGRAVPTYREDDGGTDAAPRQAVATASHRNPKSTQKNFAAAALQEEPAVLAPAPALGTDTKITAETKDRAAASAS
jgi:hypothetical protein